MRLRRTFTLLMVATAVAIPAGVASAGQIPNNWVHHQAAPWSWWTPPHWVDAHGPYDLNISSPTGERWVKFGFSGDPVFSYQPTPLENARHFFRYLRQNYLHGSLNGPGLYSIGLRSDRYTDIGAITVHPRTIDGYSRDYRQRVTFTGTRHNGARIRGEMVMDYVESNFGDSGIESFTVRSALRSGYDTTIRQLRTISQHIAYTGSLT
jgi:hypothetical protein